MNSSLPVVTHYNCTRLPMLVALLLLVIMTLIGKAVQAQFSVGSDTTIVLSEIENGFYASSAYQQVNDFDESGIEISDSPGLLNVVPDANNIIYVNKNVSGSSNNSGSSWGNAIPELRDAVAWSITWDATTNGRLQIWVASGTYLPTGTSTARNATFQLRNGVEIYGGFAGGETSLQSRNWIENVTILSGDINNSGTSTGNSYHVVTGNGTNNTAILDGFTITAGYAESITNTAQARGGGMFNSAGSPTLINLIFYENLASFNGGGMNNENGSSPILTNVTFTNNSAYSGGGMYNRGGSSPILTNVTFIGNEQIGGSGGLGGGMRNLESSSPLLTNVIFTSNSAHRGGGMANSFSSNPVLNYVTFSNNTATNSGGGIINTNNANPSLSNVIFTGNLSGNKGGGLTFENSSRSTLRNVIFSNNEALNYGGGMSIESTANTTLTNVTFEGNTTTSPNGSGGAIYKTNTGSLNITNVIMINNNITPAIYFTETPPLISFSLIQGAGASGSGWNSSYGTDGGGNILADPIFVSDENSNYNLNELSPAIRAGNPNTNLSLFPGGPDNPTDLLGNPRVMNGIIDMGALEFQGKVIYPSENNIIYVNQQVDTDAADYIAGNGNSWANASPELYEVMNWAQTWDAATNGTLQIWVAAGTYTTFQSSRGRNASFQLVNGVEFYGGFAGDETTRDSRDWNENVTILSGESAIGEPSENIYTVVTGNNTNNTAILDGFTITGGNADATFGRLNDGGGMRILSGSPTLTNIIFTGNSATGNGGGLLIRNSSNPILTNVIITGNSADGNGGGISNEVGSIPILTNVTISGNSAGSNGGGISNSGSNPSLTNVIIWGNTATNDESIFNNASTPSISFSLIEGLNPAGDGNLNGTLTTNDPQFTDSANGDFTLQDNSPAINAGNPNTNLSLFTGGPGNPLDLASNPRVINGTIDIGAFESQVMEIITVSVEITGAPGWRMMGVPVTGLTVADLAGQNLVQGIPGLSYDGFIPNLFMYDPTAATGNPDEPTGAYVFPANGATELTPGTGFIWYMWGPESNPDVPESKPFPVTIEVDGTQLPADVSLGILPEGWNLIANPFAESIFFNQITNGTDLLNIPGHVWNPNEGEFGSHVLTTSMESDNKLTVWQGVFIELAMATKVVIPHSAKTTGGTFLNSVPEGNPEASGQIEFMLEGLDTGNQVRDRAAILYFHDQATTEWDSWDVSKLFSLSYSWATVAFVGERNGESVLKAQYSLPYDLEGSYQIPIDIQLQNSSGNFRLSWPIVSNLPNGAEFILLDTLTGQQYDLTQQNYVEFSMEDPNKGEAVVPFPFKKPEIKTMAQKDGNQRFVVIVGSLSTSTDVEPELPSEVALSQNYPNPFNPMTVISYELLQVDQVRLQVFDITGRLVATLVNEPKTAGSHSITFDARNLASGVYIYRLQVGSKVISRKLTLIK